MGNESRFQGSTSDIVKRTVTSLAEGVTGLAVSEKKDFILSVGHILQRMRSGHFLNAFLKEWDIYKEKGRVKDDYEFTDQRLNCLQELLEFLDKDSPDELRFSIMKKIFLVAATETSSDRNSYLPVQYMKICRSLQSGEVLVLNSSFRISKDISTWESQHGAETWLRMVAKESGLEFPELVEIHESQLINKNLISPRTYEDRSGAQFKPYFRLTGLGHSFCKYIETYEDFAGK